MKYAIGFIAGVVTAALLLLAAFLAELEQEGRRPLATPYEEPDEAPVGV